MSTSTVTISNIDVQLSVEQLLSAVRQLGPRDRAKIAQALTNVELDNELAQLVAELYSQPPVTEISDSEILAEVRAVRQQTH